MIRTAREPEILATQRISTRRARTAAPSAPATWGRRSVQSSECFSVDVEDRSEPSCAVARDLVGAIIGRAQVSSAFQHICEGDSDRARKVVVASNVMHLANMRKIGAASFLDVAALS